MGIIPESHDKLFTWEEDPAFWTKRVQLWQKKGWTIAQHGCHHVYHACRDGGRSEFNDLSYDAQKALIDRGYESLCRHDCVPSCFFAPAHRFDDTTADVLRDSGRFRFISDGYAFYPYEERGMLFLPNIYDTPHKILPFGVYTFVFHPSFVGKRSLEKLEAFLMKNRQHFSPVEDILQDAKQARKKTVPEKALEPTIRFLRWTRKRIKKP